MFGAPLRHAARSTRLRLLVLQIRDEPEVERQEQDCFVHFSGLAPDQFAFRNVVERPAISRRRRRAASTRW